MEVSRIHTKSLSLSREDDPDKDDWRLRIYGQTSSTGLTLSPPLSQLTSALFLATTSRHVLYAPPTPICCRSLGFTQPLLPVVSALLPSQYGTQSHLAFTLVLHHIHSVVFLKPTVSSRPSVPPVAHTSPSDPAFCRHCAL